MQSPSEKIAGTVGRENRVVWVNFRFQTVGGALQLGGYGGLKVAGSITAEGAIDVFETLDEIADLVARCGATSGFAEMGATTEWSGFVNLAAALFEKGTSTVSIIGHVLATAGAPGLCGDNRFATGEVGSFPCELETTTGRAAYAIAFDITGR